MIPLTACQYIVDKTRANSVTPGRRGPTSVIAAAISEKYSWGNN